MQDNTDLVNSQIKGKAVDVFTDKDLTTNAVKHYMSFYDEAVDISVTVNAGGWLQVEFVVDDAFNPLGKHGLTCQHS